MKKLAITLFVLSMILFNSCSKDSSTSNNNTNSPCQGFNVCFTLDGKEYKGNATWYAINATKYRIVFESGTPNTAGYKNLELDMVGNTVGDYTITVPALNAGQGSFQVYEGFGTSATIYNGKSGKIRLTSVANDQWTGTFNVTTDKNGAGSFGTTNGTFTAVPKK